MNDRFRFRAWNDKVGFIHFGLDYCCGCEWWDFPDVLERKEWVVEQCTGLKDKNGKLIYEGDIVKEKLFNTDIAVIKFGNGSGFQCFYPEWKGRYSKKTKYNPGFRKDLYFWLDRKEGLEVIGNIHEHGGLLNEN